jgi:hypothetical protein
MDNGGVIVQEDQDSSSSQRGAVFLPSVSGWRVRFLAGAC